MKRLRADLGTAANGFAVVTTQSKKVRFRLGLLLMFRYGCWRWGPRIPAIADAAIYPDFIRGRLRIHSGWDNWLGYDLLAADPESDAFLRRFHARHCAAQAPVTPRD